MIYFRHLLPHFLLLSAKWKALYIYIIILSSSVISLIFKILSKTINNMYWFPR